MAVTLDSIPARLRPTDTRPTSLLRLPLAAWSMALLATILSAFLPAALSAQTAEAIAIQLANLERTYDGTAASFDPAADVSITPGTVDDYTVAISFPGRRNPPRDAGSYAVRVVATAKENSALKATANFTLVIGKAPLAVTANDHARLLGVANPRFTLNYEGFVADETETVLNRRPVGTTSAKTASPAGEYTITVIGGADNNYDITARNPGTLTVVPAFPGTYESLLFESGDINLPVGKLSLTLPARGARFTGRLDLAPEGAALPLAGSLAPTEDLAGAQGVAERRVKSGDTYRVELTVTPDGLSAALYLRANGDTENILHLEIAPPALLKTYPKAEPAPTAGAYTLALLNPLSTFGFDHPAGASYATGTVAVTGLLKFTGKFADGTKLTASAAPDATHGYRLFLRPYGSRPESYAAGDFALQPHSDLEREGAFFVPQSGIPELFYWRKAAKPSGPADKLFPEGFDPLETILVIDPWQRPAKASAASAAITLAQRLGLASDPAASGFAALTHGLDYLGQSESELPGQVEFTPANKARPVLLDPPANPRAWKISVNASTGTFSGSFKLTDEVMDDAGATRVRTRNITFQGILRQPPADDTAIGAGHFLLPPLPGDFVTETLSTEIRLQRPSD